MLKLCFATNNKNKIKEVWQMLTPDFSLLSLAEIGHTDDLEETQDTLEGNSLQKASFVYHHYQVPCFADDTGLEVEALGGAPGVYSARYAGEHRSSEDNIDLLLVNLQNEKNRKARFRTIITLVGLTKEPIFFEGIVNGVITDKPSGNKGFGYDPVFIPNGYSETFAEMALAEKNKISHRGVAFQKLISFLNSYQK